MSLYNVTTIYAFAEGTLKGNAAGVCLLDGFPDDATMQAIAQRMGHAETAFLVKGAAEHYDLRWFTPTQEVPLCGHATLAAAHWLRQQGAMHEQVVFDTQSGPIVVRAQGEQTVLQLPNKPGTPMDATTLRDCLGVNILSAKRNDTSIMVEVADMDALRHCAPDLAVIAKLDSEDLIVTTATGVHGYDYAYRCFCPQVGIDEDAATGSANCLLAAHWSEQMGKNSFDALQASPQGGALRVSLQQDHVSVGGRAVTAGTTRIDTDRTLSARGRA